MAEFTEITKIRKRMHDANKICKTCPLGYKNNGHSINCYDLATEHSEEYERICLDWAKENPEITNKNKLYQIIKEAFGEDIAYMFSVVKGCALMACKGDCTDCQNKNFWDKPYIEIKEEQDE